MYIFKVNTGDGVLSYAFHDESYGKHGDTDEGVAIFENAFKQYFAIFFEPVTMTVMNDSGLYYNPTKKAFVQTADWREVCIPLNEAAKRMLAELYQENHAKL